MEWRKEPSGGFTVGKSRLVRMGPEMKDPSVREVKLAWSQSAAASKEVVSEQEMMG